MNRLVVNSLIVGVMLAGNANAYQTRGQGTALGLEQWQAGEDDQMAGYVHYAGEWQGAGIGAIAGALLAGPPGLILGAAGGVLAGRSAGLESDLRSARQEVEQLEQQQLSQVQQLTQRLESAKSRYQQQLDAIANGFVHRIHFRTGQNVMEPDDLRELTHLAVALRTIGELRIVIHAHADRRGREGGNQNLSVARAEAVSRQLILHGVDPERIVRQAHGEADARYPAEDREGLGYDRQVVIRFLSGATS